MAEVRLSIGGLGVRLTGDESLRAAGQIPGIRTFVSAGAPEDIVINLDSDFVLPDCRRLTEFEVADGQALCRFGRSEEGVYCYDLGGELALRHDPRRPDAVDCAGQADLPLLRFALWLAYAMAGLRLGRMPMHSSAAVKDGRAVMCLGESGTGKSTHTRLWTEHIEGAYLLNDDSPILAVEDGEVRVYGSPWSGKTPCFRQESHPVAGIVRIEQKQENTLQRLRTLEAFGALQPSCPPSLARDEEMLDQIVALISTIIQQVPIYRLGCRPDAEAAQLCYRTLYESE